MDFDKLNKSNLISRDFSWLNFNYRVFDQVKNEKRNILDRLKFLSIVSSNFDEFFEVRVGSLYNYIDNNKKRIDYSGLREIPFKEFLLDECKNFFKVKNQYFLKNLVPILNKEKIYISSWDLFGKKDQNKVKKYFKNTIFPMLTPMVYDNLHSFPILMNKVLIFGVVTKSKISTDKKKISFIQIPQNLPRFFEYEIDDKIYFIPIENIIKKYINKLFRNVKIISVSLFRLIRNGDFTLEESEDIETNFLEELKQKLKDRKSSRVVRIEIEYNFDKWLLSQLKTILNIDLFNIMRLPENGLLDFSSLIQIIDYNKFAELLPTFPKPIPSFDL